MFEDIKKTLKGKNEGLIYHAHNHYMVPLGFTSESSESGEKHFLVVGDQARHPVPVLHCFDMKNVEEDLENEFPTFLNIRNVKAGADTKHEERFTKGGKFYKDNWHCLLVFRSLE
jgi:hypothetical protein